MYSWFRSLFPISPWQITPERYWFFASCGLAIIAAAYATIGLWPLHAADALVLHYTPVFGIDRIGPWGYAYFPSVLAVVVLLINSLLISALATRQRRFLSTLGAFTVALEIGCVMAAVVVVNLNR